VEKKEDTVRRVTMINSAMSSTLMGKLLVCPWVVIGLEDVIVLHWFIYLSCCVECAWMLKVSYRVVKEVWIPMLPWINSIRSVHHRTSHEYRRVVTVRGEGKGETVVTTPNRLDLFKAVACSSIVDPSASVSYLDSLVVLSSVV
jgi:hypothetical protein